MKGLTVIGPLTTFLMKFASFFFPGLSEKKPTFFEVEFNNKKNPFGIATFFISRVIFFPMAGQNTLIFVS